MDHSANHRSLWEELDALVLAEVEALKPTAPDVISLPGPTSLETSEKDERGAYEKDVQPRNLQMFDGEEEEVIARTSAWLRNRPNRDMIIDALWSAASDAGKQNDGTLAEGADETSESEAV